ncbi:MAG TPA: DNA repair protein RecN [Candidatus Limnocylindria bacterium]|nr:DNA repair protein RecN [Candidatus Limnocylindria bacterium]
MALRELTVENLAVVERVRLQVAPGFTVLTGETGAGKSLVVDAVALVLGARAASDQVRAGADALRVEAIFDAPALSGEDPMADAVAAGEGSVIVRREVGADGRSLARVNDRAVTVGGLAALGGSLGEIHGQHDQQRLLEPARQLALLDEFGGHGPLVERVAEAHRAWRATVAAAAELLTDRHELARRVELLRHQAAEIEAAAPRAGEDVELEAQLRAAEHAETIARAAAEAVAALRDDGAAGDLLGTAERAVLAAAAHDARFAPLADRLSGVAAEAAELARDIADTAEGIDLDPLARAAAEERLALLYDLRRKYGDSLEAVIAFGEEAAAELARLENQEGERERLRAEEAERRASLEEDCAALTAARRATADRLTAAVNAELPPLGLPGGAFGVEIEPIDPGPGGADRVTFRFAPNPGEPPRPLGRIASGGEASRLSLALKVVLAAADSTPLLVFDEVDAGIGGRNASALGERLRELARFHQVLCVTHLPQVAAYADAHLVVGKRVEGERTVTEVRELGPDERAAELAAMLAGERAGDEARTAAEALLRVASAGGRRGER